MKINNKIKDIVALMLWEMTSSKVSWAVVVIFSSILFILFMYPQIRHAESIHYYIIFFVAGFGGMCMLIIIASIPFVLLSVFVNLFIKGALGEKKLELNDEGIIENDSYKITKVRWENIKNIRFTKKYIFIKLNRGKFIIIPERDFNSFRDYVSFFLKIIQHKDGTTSNT